MRSRWVAALGALLVPAIAIAAILWPVPAPLSRTTDFSFESDLEGWAASAVDVAWGNCTGGALGNCTLSWSVERTTDLAHEGAASVKMSLENLNDAGKIWIERAFNVSPGRTYRVHLAFAFASADFGSMNHWTILAGALSARPTAAEDLTPAIRGDTGNGLASNGGYIWLEKGYDSIVHSGPDGRLWVLLGVWGTWETPRTYYVDAVRVSIQAT